MRIDALDGKHTGRACLVVGSAPSVLEEYAEAREHCPDAIVIAVNDAARVVSADYLASLHHELMGAFRKKSLNKEVVTISPQAPLSNADVDVWFTDCNSGATSAYAAVKMARKMGCTPIIMVGCPMDGGGGYVKQADWKDVTVTRERFGHAADVSRQIARYKEELKRHAAEEDVSMVRSMSGYSAGVFGQPDWRKNHGVQ